MGEPGLVADQFLGVSGTGRRNSSHDGRRFYEIIKAVEGQCSFLPLQEQSLTVTSQNRCFHNLHMFFIWWHKRLCYL